MSQRPPTGSSPDPIGWASARLYAGGVERQQRLATLRFLGILLESADEDGHVHCDPDDLVGLGLLYGLEADEVARSRALLETFGVLDREPTGWSIKHFAPVGDEVPPADVLAAIGRVLAKPGDAPASAERAAAAPVVVPMESARARRARRWMAAPVSAAAAAAVVVVALLVSGQVRVPLVSSPVSHSQQNAIGAGGAPSSTSPGTPAAGSSPSLSPTPSAGAATAPSIGQTPSNASGGAVTTSPATAVCPAGDVSATVDHMDQHLDSAAPSTSVRASLPPFVHTSVAGTVRNNSAAAVVVNPFPVTVNFTDPSGKTSRTVTATALSAPTSIPPNASIPWSVTVDNPQDAPVPGTANATPPTWRWDDARLASLCPR